MLNNCFDETIEISSSIKAILELTQSISNSVLILSYPQFSLLLTRFCDYSFLVCYLQFIQSAKASTQVWLSHRPSPIASASGFHVSGTKFAEIMPTVKQQ
jgi:hypothetical protein